MQESAVNTQPDEQAPLLEVESDASSPSEAGAAIEAKPRDRDGRLRLLAVLAIALVGLAT